MLGYIHFRSVAKQIIHASTDQIERKIDKKIIYINLNIKGKLMENRQMKRYIDRKVYRMKNRQIGGKLDGKLDRQLVFGQNR